MKEKLTEEMLDTVCGGFILRQANGTYLVYGRDDYGIDWWESFGNDLRKAIEFDWEHFQNFYRSRNINTEQEHRNSYERQFFNPQVY